MKSIIPTVSVTILSGLPEFVLENFGRKSLVQAYEVSGIPEGGLSLQNAYIPEASAGVFVETAARLSGEHQLGLFFPLIYPSDPTVRLPITVLKLRHLERH